ncbi:MAG: glycosyltransferase [candidate division Zixibacteria bacterium]|nr:glycosyltransferase [candidate division Zixibacteria bacterium]NIS18159.1 glycosyltransferase [candidate division Zixibacteria bacterium]NIT54432.1 glycosyltransferase [candidate division Zixibacteria bacterium]NIU16164.1 glycosyltransferase [candidate division Zixibacteria bacterium]NIV08302.1 glycosyltransferase [candidate division Zixibacteria bacterium]
MNMKILWIKSDFLYPADTGGKIRSYNILKQLSAVHEVSYLCLTEEEPSGEALDYLRSFCSKVECIPFNPDKKFSLRFYLSLVKNLFSEYPYVINKYRDHRLEKRINDFIDSKGIDIILCDFLEMAANCIDIDVPKVLFQHNVEAEIWRRHYEVSRSLLKKAYLKMEYRKFYSYERRACSAFDDVLVVSESDGRLLENEYSVRHTTLIPTGVDVDYFKPDAGKMKPENIVFVGSMDWIPNQDAAEYFVKDIYPGIKSRRPDARFYIVGRRPPEHIRILGERDNSITITGTVDDIRPYVDGARVYVVPIRIGGGTRIKIYEALAQKKAVVSTTVGAEGLPLTDGKHIIIKDEPNDFAEAVLELMENENSALKLGDSGHNYVAENYSWEKVAGKFSDALEDVLKVIHGPTAVVDNMGESR